MISEKKKSTETESSKTKTIREMSVIRHEELRMNPYVPDQSARKLSSHEQLTSEVSRSQASQPKLDDNS